MCLPVAAFGREPADVLSDSDVPRLFDDGALSSRPVAAADSESRGVPASSSAACAGRLCAPPAGAAPSCHVPVCAPACGAAGQACCHGSNCGCSDCDDPWVTIAGVEATFLHADLKGMDARAAVFNLQTDRSIGRSSSDGFDDFTYAPRVSFGVQNETIGIMGRFWYLSDSSGGLTPFTDDRGVYAGDRLKAYTVDLELTHPMCVQDSKINLFLGARYASLDTTQGIDASQLVTLNEIGYANAFNDLSFHGLGISTGFLGRSPITCDGCLSLVWGLRGSVLWGDVNRSVQTSATLIGNVSAATSINGAQSQIDDTAFIVEALLGLQWDHQLQCLPMTAFLRVAAEYQFWDVGSDGAAHAESFAVAPPGAAVASSTLGDVDLDLIGLVISTGFNW
jgi:hypothetical protein